jgi:hypothetical protein
MTLQSELQQAVDSVEEFDNAEEFAKRILSIIGEPQPGEPGQPYTPSRPERYNAIVTKEYIEAFEAKHSAILKKASDKQRDIYLASGAAVVAAAALVLTGGGSVVSLVGSVKDLIASIAGD